MTCYNYYIMVNKKYVVKLTTEDREFLQHFISGGKRSAREFQRAWILLLADKGKIDVEISELLNVSLRTVERIRTKYVTDGLESAIQDKPRPGQPRKLSSSQEAHIIAIACSDAPEGRERWTLELLREEAIKRSIVDNISTEPIRILLKKHDLKPWKKKTWCISELTDEFIERMNEILELYERPYNSKEPVICFDEKSKQLIADSRAPLPMKPGMPKRVDSEYIRNGTANVFMMVEPKAGLRYTIVRKRRTKKDFSICVEKLVSIYKTKVNKVHIVLDNLNTHFEKSLVDTFGKKKAKKIMKNVIFHHTPKHGSFQNL